MGDFMNDFNLCPNCGSKNIKNVKNRKWLCQDCGFDLYNNVASAVGLIICDKENKILLEERAKEPKKGFLAFPGGFCDADESAEDSAIRECQEETGLTPAKLTYIASFPNTYPYKNITYKTCDFFFLAEFEQGAVPVVQRMNAQKTEVQSFKNIQIKSKSDVDKLPLAFESARNALYAWLKFKDKNKS